MKVKCELLGQINMCHLECRKFFLQCKKSHSIFFDKTAYTTCSYSMTQKVDKMASAQQTTRTLNMCSLKRAIFVKIHYQNFMYCDFILFSICLKVNQKSVHVGARSLAEACLEGDVGAVRKLLEEGWSVHEPTDEGESLLSLACSAGLNLFPAFIPHLHIKLAVQVITEVT